MNSPFLIVFLYLLSSSSQGAAQTGEPNSSLSLQPTVAVLIGIFSLVFSLSFILLVYAKICHSIDADVHTQHLDGLLEAHARFSGIDRSVVESLPFFKFSSLKGPRQGLECAVCLTLFDDNEILRLLPKCKHAFHIACVDRWLESHSSCPLCRCKVEGEDATVFKYSTSSRFLFSENQLEERDDHGIYVERKSSRKTGKDEILMHKHMHRIILSDVVFKNRWSDLRSSDFISLKSEMLAAVSSRRFTDGGIDCYGVESTSGSYGKSNVLDGKCASEIINVSRFAEGTNRRLGFGDSSDSREEKMRRLWVPIAKRTVQLFGGREKKPRRSEFVV